MVLWTSGSSRPFRSDYAISQQHLNVLAGLSPECCLVNLENVLVHGLDFDAAFEALREILERIHAIGLKLHPAKRGHVPRPQSEH